jgi:hypothetical protein
MHDYCRFSVRVCVQNSETKEIEENTGQCVCVCVCVCERDDVLQNTTKVNLNLQT